MISGLMRREETHRDKTDRQEDGCVKMDAEIGVRLSTAKEQLGLPEAVRNKNGFFPGALEEGVTLLRS